MTFFGTFGKNHFHDGKIAKDYYVEITANTVDEARDKMYENFGSQWSMVYAPSNFSKGFYPKGCLIKL